MNRGGDLSEDWMDEGRPVQSQTLPVSFIPLETDYLLQELAKTDAAWADGASLYGPGGLFDHTRSSYRKVIYLLIEEEHSTTKMTDGKLNTMSGADLRYVQFLDEHKIRRAQWLVLDQQRDALKTRLRLLTYSKS